MWLKFKQMQVPTAFLIKLASSWQTDFPCEVFLEVFLIDRIHMYNISVSEGENMQINLFPAPCWRSRFTDVQILSEFKPAFSRCHNHRGRRRNLRYVTQRLQQLFFLFQKPYWNCYKKLQRDSPLTTLIQFSERVRACTWGRNDHRSVAVRIPSDRVSFHQMLLSVRKKKSRPVAFRVARRCGSFVCCRTTARITEANQNPWRGRWEGCKPKLPWHAYFPVAESEAGLNEVAI